MGQQVHRASSKPTGQQKVHRPAASPADPQIALQPHHTRSMLKRALIEIHGSLPWIACPFVAVIHRIIAPLMSSRDKLAFTNCMPFFLPHHTWIFLFWSPKWRCSSSKKIAAAAAWDSKQKLHFFRLFFIVFSLVFFVGFIFFSFFL